MIEDEKLKELWETIPEEQRDAILGLLKPKTVLDVPALVQKFERKYYHITEGVFETVVSELDAKSESEAIRVARTDKLQPWYSHGTMPREIQVSVFTHDEYCAWLHRGGC